MKDILKKYKEISVLNEIAALLDWDMSVNLPINGSSERAKQSGLITDLITDRWLKINPNSIKIKTPKDKAIVRNLKQAVKFYHKVPKEVISKFEETSSNAYMAWVNSRKKDNFKIFAPHLEKMVEQNRIISKYYGYKENPYDALLDMHEMGLTVREVKEIFNKLTPELTEIIKKIKIKNESPKNSGVYPIEKQKELSNFVIQKMGYDLGSGRMDISPHPFTTELGTSDVRITNRYTEKSFVESLMSAMHEAGHALYEQGVNPKFANTPLAGGVSLGIHESQSRFWENQVGRSMEFSIFLTPIIHKYFPNTSNLKAIDIYKMFNNVKPSLIRTEADEVTYNLHIVIRFEIEEALINGKLKVKDVPLVWKEKMKKYLGVIVSNDKDGVLQDVHWSQGFMGYFPTYTLGNLYSAQFTNTLKKKINISKLIEKGNFLPIRNWLKENIHQYGSLLTPEELVIKLTGEKLNSKYFIDYIKNKYL